MPSSHHPVAGVETGFDDPKLTLTVSGFHDLALNDVVRADHQHISALLARPDRVVSRQYSLVQMADRRPNAREQAWQQPLILVVE